MQDYAKQKQRIERDIEHCAEGLKEAKEPMARIMWKQGIERLTSALKQIDTEVAFHLSS